MVVMSIVVLALTGMEVVVGLWWLWCGVVMSVLLAATQMVVATGLRFFFCWIWW